MKIICTCGEKIHDSADRLSNKAHILGDKDLFKFFDAVDDAISDNTRPNQHRFMHVRHAFSKRLAWECHACGRLFLDNEKNELVEYVPQNGSPNSIFDR